jgi:hypothetical protein
MTDSENALLRTLYNSGLRFSPIGNYFAFLNPLGVYFRPHINVSQLGEQAFKCRIDMTLVLPGGYSFIESFASQDRSEEGAIQQCARFYIQFCHNPLISAFGAPQSDINVEAIKRNIQGITYTCYTAGPRIMAVPANAAVPIGNDLIPVVEEFMKIVVDVIDSTPVSGRYHTYRALAARVNDQPTSEFLLDTEPHGDQHHAFVNLRRVQNAGYTNFRYFELMLNDGMQLRNEPVKKETQKTGFFSVFSKKKEEPVVDETSANNILTFEESVARAIEIMTTTGLGKDSDELEELFKASGISADDAERMVVFLPIIAMRHCYVGYEWPEYYIFVNSSGGQEKKRFSENEYFMKLKDQFGKWAFVFGDEPLPLIISTRSAEHGTMNQALQANVAINKSTFSSMLIVLHQD